MDVARHARENVSEGYAGTDIGGENDRLVGMVTDRDITVRAVANAKDISALTARDVMTKGIVWCRDNDDVTHAANVMQSKQIRRLPVIDKDKRMVGIIREPLTPVRGGIGMTQTGLHPDFAIAQFDREDRYVIRPKIKGAAALEIEAGVVPMTGKDAVLDAPPFEREAHVRATIVEGKDAPTVVDNKDWTMAAVQPFELLEHPAEIKLRARGATLAELFANAARGMMAYMFGDELVKAKPERWERIEITAPDGEALLVDWLSELLYRATSGYCGYVGFEADEIDEQRLAARVGTVSATAIDDIKAVTHHELTVRKCDGGWEATVVFDI
jgi:SHS2 domain-containing protein